MDAELTSELVGDNGENCGLGRERQGSMSALQKEKMGGAKTLSPHLSPHRTLTISPELVQATQLINTYVNSSAMTPAPRTPTVENLPRFGHIEDQLHQASSVLESLTQRSLGPQTQLSEILAPVVKIYANHVYPNYSMPWQMRRQQKSTSSGFVIQGRRLLSNAHGLEYHTSVRVRKYGDAKKYSAKVLFIGHECDLALLTVQDEEFWKDLPALEFGEVPNLQDAVTVIGYPTGGDNISVTKGVVSRIDVQEYSHANARLLAVQIDAAINPGNSGGPALKDNKVIGVAFEALTEAENIGYIIPVPIIHHFLQDVDRNSRYTGFCGIGFAWQHLESTQCKNYLKMSEYQTGVLINSVFPLAPAAKYLRKDDVLLSVDGAVLADDGTVEFRRGERVSFIHTISSKFVGDSCSLKILRNGEMKTFDVKLVNPTNLVPVHCSGKTPAYLIYGGLVFVPLNRPYLQNEYGKEWDKKAPIRLCDLAFNAQMEHEGDQVVLLSQVLAGEVNVGYHNVGNIQLESINGVPVRNMKHLKELLQNNREPFVRFDLYKDKVIVLRVADVESTKDELTKEHSIHTLISPDLL
eukprot:GILJ01012166.1.p1 GENE.GILJ01012166.1~~GILJ01012166.1.p1  ORF type:complete len:580 (-),score=90.18 GILJ01012166.1:114-1853(-)